jgi:hypothetical protein
MYSSKPTHTHTAPLLAISFNAGSRFLPPLSIDDELIWQPRDYLDNNNGVKAPALVVLSPVLFSLPLPPCSVLFSCLSAVGGDGTWHGLQLAALTWPVGLESLERLGSLARSGGWQQQQQEEQGV